MALIDLQYLESEDLYYPEDEVQKPSLDWIRIAEPNARPRVCLATNDCIEQPTYEAVLDLPNEYAADNGSHFFVLLTVACDKHAQ